MTFFPTHFALALRRSRFALLALLCSAVLPVVPRAQEAPKPQERFYLSDKVLEELGIKPSITYLADISNPADAKDKA